MMPSPLVAAVVAALAPLAAVAQDAAPAPAAPASAPVQRVTVTATRVATPPFDVPASVDVVGVSPDADGRPGINISESLGPVPGLVARDRQNYAQDVQLSVRGFGARSTFGIRGVRVYVDGIPGTLPDGQGQISNVDLASAERIEVLRGPFSALYGNSSGGVVQVFTEDGRGPPTLTVGGGAGSDGQRRVETKLAGAQGGFDYVASGTHFQTDGWRDHSGARRDIENVKLGLKLDDASKLTIIGNAVDVPEALDPMGLSRAELTANPRGVDPAATNYDTRKSLSQQQGGLVYERRLGGHDDLRALAYGGHRATTQFQSIPAAAQANPLSPGGVIDLGRDYEGADLRWTHHDEVAGQRWNVVAGLAWDTLREHRQGYENFTGSGTGQVLGVQGALRRDETNDVTDLDPYVQAEWHPTDRWTLDAGVRRSRVRFTSHDHYVTDANPDDSGAVDYSATLPVLGVLYALRPDVHLYASAGRGFETPTLNELAYRPDGLTGLNLALRPARSTSLEFGVKTQSADWGTLNVAAYVTHTSDEIVTLTNTGGRSNYQNAASTRRRGVEAEWSKTLPHDLLAQAAFTLDDARYGEDYAAGPGHRIPGVPRETAYAALAWQPERGWRAGVEARGVSHVEVNDANSDAAATYAIASASAGYVWAGGAWRVTGFARVDNLFDRAYVGSVIVNEGNARFFEPAPGRTVFGGVTASVRF